MAQAYGAAGHITGGILIVTNYRLVFQPWNLHGLQELVKWGCRLIQVPHASAVNYVVGRLVSIVDSQAVGVGGIIDVYGVGRASLTAAPQICVEKDDGTVAKFGVVASVGTPSGSRKNNDVRDRLVEVARRVFM
ncbi:hypothetical protein LQ327_33430 [Actinomycetospora endophytica]|uniref:GRAM domain-containing protein n=1 Tax=Actinomycetospora endophytica TaxID=2291215 RepID=A0ABS8PMU4_9PSEU|nr:hypothetical protein [Actinomycetospora endophytica]MCD2198279.1 hypothetical protein [Actinomycetospora endophytica]